MFTKNFYILSKGNILGSDQPFNSLSCLCGPMNPLDMNNLVLENGETHHAISGTTDYYFENSSNGRGYGYMKCSNAGGSYNLFRYQEQNGGSYFYQNNDQTSNSSAVTEYGTTYLSPIFRVASGNTNDTTPVTLDDYNLSNYLFDNQVTLNCHASNGGTRQLTVSNITNSSITVREIGCFLEGLYMGENPQITNPFGITPYSGQYAPVLIWKVKLQTPITLPANSTKKIIIDFLLPE